MNFNYSDLLNYCLNDEVACYLILKNVFGEISRVTVEKVDTKKDDNGKKSHNLKIRFLKNKVFQNYKLTKDGFDFIN